MDSTEFLIGAMIVIIILFVGVGIFFGVIFNIGTPNDGSHTGYVTSVEKSGLIFRTNAVYFKTDTQSSQEDKYCATDEVVDQLKQAQVEKKLVTINYKRAFLMPIWECPMESETEIISIK